MTRHHARGLAAGILGTVLLTACSGVDAGPSAGPTRTTTASPSDSATRSAGPEPDVSVEPPPSRPAREPRRSYLSIPALDLRSVPVVRYTGSPDDAPGTRIQNRGPTASPRGPEGGVGPGEVGNFVITGHRTSHAAPFRNLPALRRGDRVRVRSGQTEYVYRVVTTRWTSFRSERSRAEQVAAVPGHPDAAPVRPMITLSTCATPEDHAAGNYWADRFGNPEHRIDKVGVLVAELGTDGR